MMVVPPYLMYFAGGAAAVSAIGLGFICEAAKAASWEDEEFMAVRRCGVQR